MKCSYFLTYHSVCNAIYEYMEGIRLIMSGLDDTQILSDEDSCHAESMEDKFSYLIVNDTWHEVLKGETRIGRDGSQCSIVLEDNTISKVHAAIESEGPSDTFIYDVGSVNKTKFGKMILRPQCRYKINNNDVITLGKIDVKFKIVNEKIENCKFRLSETVQEVERSNSFDKTDSQTGTSKSDTTFMCKTEENTKLLSQARVSLKEIIKTPKKYYYTLASEVLNSDIFNQTTQCEGAIETLNNKPLKLLNNDLNNSDYDIYNMPTQCEYFKNSHEPHLLISDFRTKEEKNSSFERAVNSELDNSSPFSFMKENYVPVKKIQTYKFSSRDLSHYSDIYDMSTQFENPKNSVTPNGTIREQTTDQDSNNKCVERVQNSYFDKLSVKNNEGKLYNPTNMCISLSDDLFDLATQNHIKSGNSQTVIEDVNEQNTFPSTLDNKDKDSVMEKDNLKNHDSKLLSDGEDEQLCELMRVSSPEIPSDDEYKSNPDNELLQKNTLLLAKASEEIFDVPTQINFSYNDVECHPRVVQEKTHEKLDLEVNSSSQSLFSANNNKSEKDAGDLRKKCNMNQKNLKKMHFSFYEKDNPENFNIRHVSKEDESQSTSEEKITEKMAHDIESDHTQFQRNGKVECSVADHCEEIQMPDKNDGIISQTSFKIGSGVFPEEEGQNICKTVDYHSDEDKSIDSGEETESDLEIKLGLNKTETPSGNSNKNAGKENDNIDFAPLCNRRSSSSSDRTLSDLDIINELRNSESLLGNDVVEDFISTQEFLLENKQRSESGSKTDSGLEADEAGTKVGLICEDSVSNELFPSSKFPSSSRRSASESSDRTTSDLEEVIRPIEKIGDYDIVDVSSGEDVYDIEEASTESESLFKKEIEDESDAEKEKQSVRFGRCVSPILLPLKEVNGARTSQDEIEDFIVDSTETDCDEELRDKEMEVPASTSTTGLGRKERGKAEEKEIGDLGTFNIECDYVSNGSPSKRTRKTKGVDVVPKKRSKTARKENLRILEAEPRTEVDGKLEQNRSSGMDSNSVNSNAGKKGARGCSRTSSRLRKNNVDGKLKQNSSAIVFTGFESEVHNKIISKLGGSRVNDLVEASVLVTDRVKRTVKFLSALASGMPIVSPKWLILSEKEGDFLDPWEHLLQDEPSEERWNFTLKSSLEKWKKRKLLNGFTVYATESTKPPIPEILSIVKCCGGIPLTSSPAIWPKKSLVLTCLEDKESWPSPTFKHVKIVHYEFLLIGVLRHFLDFKTYKLR